MVWLQFNVSTTEAGGWRGDDLAQHLPDDGEEEVNGWNDENTTVNSR